jgi:hypothetical protein
MFNSAFLCNRGVVYSKSVKPFLRSNMAGIVNISICQHPQIVRIDNEINNLMNVMFLLQYMIYFNSTSFDF